ncbi:MAG: glycosyltransferase family 1 protein [Gammaproteobacteria bacterium]|nr:MAG: glycosyltransferase family 1 protein [Gammaproteobacteria bacterium]
MSSIRLALIRQKYRPDGGAERFLSRAMEALKEDIELTIITRNWQKQDGVNVINCNPPKWGRVSREKGFAKAVCEQVENRNFDLVQSHERIACCDIYRAGDGIHKEWLNQRSRIISPAARVMTNISPFHRYMLRAEERLFNSDRLKTIICNSKMIAEEIALHFPAASSKTEVIYSSIDFKTYNPNLKRYRKEVRENLGISKDESVFLFVGSGFERKGASSAIKAISGVKKAKLLVIGKDKNLTKYKKLSSDLSSSSKVIFMGMQENPLPFYGAADAFIFPTLYDPFPNVTIEALACGLPVITSTKCGAAEIIANGKDGFVCDALDAKSMTKFIEELKDKNTQKQMSGAAYEKAQMFSTERMTKQLMDVYGKLLRQKTTGN